MTEAAKKTWHAVFAVVSMAALIAIPIVSHSVFGNAPLVQLAMSLTMTVLASLGLTKVRPLIDLGIGSLKTHKNFAQAATAICGGLLVARGTYGVASPAVALTCDILISALGALGVTVVKTGSGDPPATDARTKQTGLVVIELLLTMCIGAVLFVFAIAFAGCAPTSAYVNALRVKGDSSEFLRTAYQAWHVYDRMQQDSIIAGAPDFQTGMKELTAWRDGTRQKVDDAFVTADHAVAAYSDSLKTADATKRRDYGAAIGSVLAALDELANALKDAGINLPELKTPQPTGARQLLLAALNTRLQRARVQLRQRVECFVDETYKELHIEKRASPCILTPEVAL
jgi:hypothetical protein